MSKHISLLESVDLENGGEFVVQASNSARHITVSFDFADVNTSYRVTYADATEMLAKLELVVNEIKAAAQD